MADIFTSFKGGLISDAPLSSGVTTINSAGFVNLPVVAAPDTMRLVLDPEGAGGVPEIVLVTDHPAAATSVTATRGQETASGGSAGRSHATATPWVAGVTVAHLNELPYRKTAAKGTVLAGTAANAVAGLPVGTDGQVLVAASGEATGLDWTQVGTASLANDAVTVAKLAPGIMSSGGETGPDAAGPTVGATALTFDTFTFADPGIAGRLHVWATAGFSKTVGTDRFSITLEADGTPIATTGEESPATATTQFCNVSGSVAVPGGAAVVINAIISRTSGTGTATLGVGSTVSLHHIFIPTVA